MTTKIPAGARENGVELYIPHAKHDLVLPPSDTPPLQPPPGLCRLRRRALDRMPLETDHSRTRGRNGEAADDVTCAEGVTVKVARGSRVRRSISIDDSRRASAAPGASPLAPVRLFPPIVSLITHSSFLA